jgi:hypothetical protein
MWLPNMPAPAEAHPVATALVELSLAKELAVPVAIVRADPILRMEPDLSASA